MADVFGDKPINDNVTLETLVGEGKKYSDPNDVAKAYVNLEAHLEELKRDNAILRVKADAKELNVPEEPSQQRQPDPAPSEPVKPQNSDKDLRELVSAELQSQLDNKRFEENIEKTAARLVEIYGDGAKAQQMIRDRAKLLGVSVEWLRDTAARSPEAFYSAMDVRDNPGNRQTPSPGSDIRVDVNRNANQKNYAFYQELRKTNKDQYFSAATQAEMQKAAREMGDAFYS